MWDAASGPNKMYEVYLSPATIRRLEEAHSYIAENLKSPQAADATIAAVLKALEVLENNPDAGPRLSSRIDELPECFSETRFFVCGRYVAVYEHRDKRVEILRLYHGSEDVFGRLLREID
ncbi:MAG: type II toxin-antitoxin system RelE/ParE family toxin [Coriobacteriales bacterium]|jgi:plasmid stabilization system protein ParE|nr:type II toxin-antitoxin system RelE/ParE family toxin [Coriobacteriales bacterium]